MELCERCDFAKRWKIEEIEIGTYASSQKLRWMVEGSSEDVGVSKMGLRVKMQSFEGMML